MEPPLFFDGSPALKRLERRHGDSTFQGKWSDKHWMSTPGPLYCGDTDNCGTGPAEAPNNVEVDKEGYQVIYRQPVNLYELRQVVQAASDDPFSGYGANGDKHWSYEAIRMWWAEQQRKIVQEVRQLYEAQLALGTHKSYAYCGGLWRWLNYLEDGVYQYLQAYAFFLDTGHTPQAGDTLPDL